MRQNAQSENWVNLLLGGWIFIIPWTLRHSLPSTVMAAAMWNFWVVGAVIFLAALMAIQDIKPWKEWTNLVAGGWLIMSPWVFGYTSESTLLWHSIVAGILVTALSGMALPIANRNQHNAR